MRIEMYKAGRLDAVYEGAEPQEGLERFIAFQEMIGRSCVVFTDQMLKDTSHTAKLKEDKQ